MTDIIDHPEDVERAKNTFFSIVSSILYAVIIYLSETITLIPGFENVNINLAIFVPAVTAIIFGKTVGATSASGGKLLSIAGNSLLLGTGTFVEWTTLFSILSNAIGGWTVGALRQNPVGLQEETFTKRFTSNKTWGRIGGNTLSSIIGIGMATSFVDGFGNTITGQMSTTEGVIIFIQQFFVSSLILLIIIPITLFFYETGDLIVDSRIIRIDKSLRKLLFSTEKEEVAVITKIDLPKRAFTKNTWVPLKIRFRNVLSKESVFNIEGVSTARIHPSRSTTKLLQPTEVYEQTFFVHASVQESISLRFRIAEKIQHTWEENNQQKETIVDINGRSYNPKRSTLTMIIFSISNFLTVGVGILWDNILSIITKISDFDYSVFFHQSFSFIGILAAMEAVIFIPFLILMRRRLISLSNKMERKVSLSTDVIKEKTAKSFRVRLAKIFEESKRSISLYLKVALIYLTFISVIILGVEGYKALFDGSYNTTYSTELMYLAIGIFFAWFIGLRGIDLLKEAGLLEKEKCIIDEDGAVIAINPVKDFVKAEPNELIIRTINISKNPGIRIQLTGLDTISPSTIELKVAQGKQGTFRASVTPVDLGKREILAIAYPLYDENGMYIPLDVAEPLSNQRIHYQVKSSDELLGMNKQKRENLLKIGSFLVLLVSTLFASNSIINAIFGEIDIENFIQRMAPYIIAIQVPFIYAYVHVKTRIQHRLDQLNYYLEKDSISNTVIKEYEKLFSKDFVKTFREHIVNKAKKRIIDTTKTLVKTKTSKQIEEEIISITDKYLRKEIQVITTSDMAHKSDSNLELVIKEIVAIHLKKSYGKIILKMINNAKKSKMDDEPFKGKITPKEREQLAESIAEDVKKLFYKEVLKKESTQKFEQDLIERLSEEITPYLSKPIKKRILKDMVSDVRREIQNEIETGLVDDIFEEIEKSIDKTIIDRYEKEISAKLTDRSLTRKLVEEIDEWAGANLTKELETTIGTKQEMATIQKIEEGFKQRIKDELISSVKKKLLRKIKKQTKRYLKKHLKGHIESKLEEKLEEELQKYLKYDLSQQEWKRIIRYIVDREIETQVRKTIV